MHKSFLGAIQYIIPKNLSDILPTTNPDRKTPIGIKNNFLFSYVMRINKCSFHQITSLWQEDSF